MLTPEQIIKLKISIDKIKKIIEEGRCNDPEQGKIMLRTMEAHVKYNDETDEEGEKRREKKRKEYQKYIKQYKKSWGGDYRYDNNLLMIDTDIFLST